MDCFDDFDSHHTGWDIPLDPDEIVTDESLTAYILSDPDLSFFILRQDQPDEVITLDTIF